MWQHADWCANFSDPFVCKADFSAMSKDMKYLVLENYIGGKFVPCSKLMESFDPSTGEIYCKVPDSGPEEVCLFSISLFFSGFVEYLKMSLVHDQLCTALLKMCSFTLNKYLTHTIIWLKTQILRKFRVIIACWVRVTYLWSYIFLAVNTLVIKNWATLKVHCLMIKPKKLELTP